MLSGAAVAGGVAACDSRAAFRLLKLLLCCCLVAAVLEWCSSKSAARWVVAVVVVVGLRLLAEHVDVRRRLAWPPQISSSSKGAAAEADEERSEQLSNKQPGTPRNSRQHRDHDAWRKLVGSNLVASAWDKLCNSIIQEFIYDAWFGQLSPDREFPAEVRWQLNHAFGQASRRAKRLDWTSLLIRDCSAALCSTLQLYRTAADTLGPATLRALPAAEADAAIRKVLNQQHLLHPAFSSPDGQYQTCKRLSEAVLVHIMPPEDRACPMMRAMLRELFATCLLRSALSSLAPYSINKLLLNVMAGGANQRVVTQEMACAAAEFQRKGTNSSKAEQNHVKQLTTENRSQKTLLNVANRAREGLARASGSSSMKRSKSLGDVKEAAGSKSPGRAAAAAAAAAAATATVWPSGSSAMAKTFSRWRDSPSSSPIRSATSAMQPAGQQASQALLGGMGAVKAAAQQLSLRRRLGADARLGAGRVSMAAVMGSSPPSSSVGADSPRSCASAVELGSSPDPMAGYRIAAAAAAARAMSTGGFTGAWSSSQGASGSMFRSPAVASSGSSSSSARSPVVAALCGLSRTPWSSSSSQSGAAAAATALLTRPHGKLRAQVVSADMLSLDSKDCIVYKVRVADDRGEWTVTRRYRHFEALHKRLKDAPHYKDLPCSLPPKRLLTARDAPFVMKRRDELDCYLQALLRSSFLRSHPELVQFLEQQSELYSMAAAADELQGIRPLADVDVLGHRSRSDDAAGLNSWRGVGGGCEPSQQVNNGSCCSSSGTWQPQQQQQSSEGPGRVCCSSVGGSSVSGSLCGHPSAELQGSSSAGTVHSIQSVAQNYLSEDRPAVVGTRVGVDLTSSQELPVYDHSNDRLSEVQQARTIQQSVLAAGQALPAQQFDGSNGPIPPTLLQQDNVAAAMASPLHNGGQSSSCSSNSRRTCDFLRNPVTAHSQQDWAAQVSQQAQPQQPPQLLQAADSVDPRFCEQQAAAVPQLPSSPPVPNKALPGHSLAVEGTSSGRTPGTPTQLSKQESDAAHAAKGVEKQQQPLGCSQNHSQLWAPAAQLAGSGGYIQAVAAEHSAPSDAAASRSASMPVSSSELGVTAAAAAAAAVRRAAANTGDVHGASSKPAASNVLEAKQPRSARSAAGTTAISNTVDSSARVAAAGSSDCLGLGPPQRGLLHAALNTLVSPGGGAQAAGAQAAASRDWQQLQHFQQQEAHGSAAAFGVQDRKEPEPGSSSSSTSSKCRAGEVKGPGEGRPAGPAATSNPQQWQEDSADWQDCVQDSTGLIVPLYEVVSCAFELQNQGFVRRPVITIVRQLLSVVAGDAIDEFLQKALANGLSEESISRQLIRLQAQLWPGGVWFARAAAAAAGSVPQKGPPITAEHFLDWAPPADCNEVAEQLRQRLMASNVPSPLLALLGKNAYLKCMDDIYGMMQSKTLMYHLGLTLVETVLVAMFPEIKGTVRAMHQASGV